MATTKKLYAARDFSDAGTDKSFKLGDDVSAEAGADNYVAAGLAAEEKPTPASDPAPLP